MTLIQHEIFQGEHKAGESSESDLSVMEEDGLKSFGFEWEQTFGKLTNEKLQQLQKFAKNKEGDHVHALSTSTDLNTIGLRRNSYMKGKMVGPIKYNMYLDEFYFSFGTRTTVCPC